MLVLRELCVYLVHVGLEARNLGPVNLPLFGVPFFDCVYILGTVAFMVVQVAAVARSVTLREASYKVGSICSLLRTEHLVRIRWLVLFVSNGRNLVLRLVKTNPVNKLCDSRVVHLIAQGLDLFDLGVISIT